MPTQSQTTEEKILAAAEKEFLLKGMAGSRTTSIAKEAGVTHAMLHYYFRTKENLFERIISDKMSALGELMLKSLSGSNLPLFEKLESTICHHLDFISENPDLPKFLISEVFSSPERLEKAAIFIHKAAGKVITSLQEEIDENARMGRCRRVDAQMLLLDIVSLNIFSFIAQPIVENVLPGLFANKERFLEMRKKENVETIMRKLKI